MFTIQQTGFFRKKQRLLATQALQPTEFGEVAVSVGRRPSKARKTGFVAARRTDQVEKMDTCWEGKETTNTAHPGDWVATTLTPQREVLRDRTGHHNTYVISSDTFSRIYEPVAGKNEFGNIFAAKGIVEAIYLSGGFEIIAPWGEKQIASTGYLLRNGAKIYGNNEKTFKATYELL